MSMTRQKKYVLAGIVALVLILAFLGGRQGVRTVKELRSLRQETAVLHVQLRTSEEHASELETSRQRLRQELDHAKSHSEVVVVTRPDGTKIVRRTEDKSSTTSSTDSRNEKTAEKQDDARTSVASVDAKKTLTERVETKEVSQGALPGWFLGVQAGVALHQQPQLVPFLPTRFAGSLSLDRRLFGSLYAGVWVSTAGAAGLSLRLGLP